MEIITAENISKVFSGHVALDSINLAIPEGSIFGLLGPNGAGKTTFLRIVNQIIAPDHGRILFKGTRLKPTHIEEIGYLPEERGLYKKMKVGEQALYLARLKGMEKNNALIKLKEWFERFEIASWWNKKVEELSKGMQQKVQFIITVIHEPHLLIFDEPFSGFDPINVNILKEEILKLKKNGATIIFSTHNMASVEELCDHIVLINKSKKILEGSVKEIKNTYKSNVFEIHYLGYSGSLKAILKPHFQVINQTMEDDLSKAVIKLPGNSSPNELLSQLMPDITIYGMKEIIPTMNDIFIQCVKEDAHSNMGHGNLNP